MNPVREVKAIMTMIMEHDRKNETPITDAALAERLVTAVREMDFALTGKTECRNHDREWEHAEALLEGFDSWEIYLSDCGYSRVWLDPFPLGDSPMWIARGDPMTCGSRYQVVEKYDQMMEEGD